MHQRITVVRLPVPHSNDINYELQWLGRSLGLFGERDKDRSCFRVFITLVKEGKRRPLSSDSIAEQLNLSRGTVVHHVNNLVENGLVVRDKGGYELRVESLQGLMEEVQRDMDRMFSEMKKISRQLDEWMGGR